MNKRTIQQSGVKVFLRHSTWSSQQLSISVYAYIGRVLKHKQLSCKSSFEATSYSFWFPDQVLSPAAAAARNSATIKSITTAAVTVASVVGAVALRTEPMVEQQQWQTSRANGTGSITEHMQLILTLL
jgi:hypothetical protein